MLISNNAPIYSLQNTHSDTPALEVNSTEPNQSLDNGVTISDLGHQLHAAEKNNDSQLTALNIEKDAYLKMQYQQNLALFIANAQRYSQQDVATPFIENRAAIAAYSLIENKVVATTASNELEQ
jgi:hypothetical protein